MKQKIEDKIYPKLSMNGYDGSVFSLLELIDSVIDSPSFNKDNKVYMALDKYETVQGVKGVMESQFYNNGVALEGTRDESLEMTILEFQKALAIEFNKFKGVPTTTRLFFGINDVYEVIVVKGTITLRVSKTEHI